MRDLKKSNEPLRPIDSVALVRTTRRHFVEQRFAQRGPTSIGAAASFQPRPAAARCAPLDPIDRAGHLLRPPRFKLPGQDRAADRGPIENRAAAFRRSIRCPAACTIRARLHQRRAEPIRHDFGARSRGHSVLVLPASQSSIEPKKSSARSRHSHHFAAAHRPACDDTSRPRLVRSL